MNTIKLGKLIEKLAIQISLDYKGDQHQKLFDLIRDIEKYFNFTEEVGNSFSEIYVLFTVYSSASSYSKSSGFQKVELFSTHPESDAQDQRLYFFTWSCFGEWTRNQLS